MEKYNAISAINGFNYQFLIALKICFLLGKGEQLYIETDGDIAVYRCNEKYTIEVKHHDDDHHKITNSDKEIWKTINNWVSSSKEYDKYYIVTTSIIEDSCIFYDWNRVNTQDKKKLLYDNGKNKKSIKKYYDTIFDDENKKKLSYVLERSEIYPENRNINYVKDIFYKDLRSVKDENKNAVLDELMGWICASAKKNIDNDIDIDRGWEIKEDEFNKVYQEIIAKYVQKKSLLTNDLKKQITDEEKKRNRSRDFVKKIEEIEFTNYIDEAINDYCVSNNIIMKFMKEDTIYVKNIELYKDELSKKIKHKYDLKKLDIDENSNIIKESQKYYLETIDADVIPINGIDGNTATFQNGVIHEIMDDEQYNYKWKLEK